MTTSLKPVVASRLRIRASAGRYVLRDHVSSALALLILAGLAFYHWRYEGWRETIIFSGAVTGALISGLTFISRRPLFSSAVIAALLAIVVTAADVKRRFVSMVLHAYDVVFYLTSKATLSFLWADHKNYLLALLAALLATVMLGFALIKIDRARVPRSFSAMLFAAFCLAALWASEAKGERRNTSFYWDNSYLTSFYASWRETAGTLWRGQLVDAAKTQSDPLFAAPASCAPAHRPPHVILIHQESVVPPSYFPSVGYDSRLDRFFKSFDGKTHKLRVETYGGASWLTEFSVLTGLSTYSFGGMRTFVQSMMQGKVHDTLPEALARCGYRNAAFYPVPKEFVSDGQFYAAAGIPDVFDFYGQNAKRYNERDKFYYGNVLDHIEKSLASSRSPVFAYVLTSATHLPYQFTYEPEEQVPGGAPGTDPEMSEYLRRLFLAKVDYDAFRDGLAKRFPNEQFLIVQYGDHQPVATRTLLGFDRNLAAEDVKMAPDNPGFETFYSVDGVNYAPAPPPDAAVLDVPYLPAVLLQAAGLPLSEPYRARLEMLKACDGHYYTCADKTRPLAFHRRLIDSGLLDAR